MMDPETGNETRAPKEVAGPFPSAVALCHSQAPWPPIALRRRRPPSRPPAPDPPPAPLLQALRKLLKALLALRHLYTKTQAGRMLCATHPILHPTALPPCSYPYVTPTRIPCVQESKASIPDHAPIDEAVIARYVGELGFGMMERLVAAAGCGSVDEFKGELVADDGQTLRKHREEGGRILRQYFNRVADSGEPLMENQVPLTSLCPARVSDRSLE